MNPLSIPKADLGRGARIPLTVLRGNADVVARFADDMLAEYRAALAAGRPQAVFIVPVGPVGHYDLLADRCNAGRISLRRLVLINMDEYLTADGLDWIPTSAPLSFRRHMDEHFYARLDPDLAPPPGPRVWPDPRDLDGVGLAAAISIASRAWR